MKASLTQEFSVHTEFWNYYKLCSMLWEIPAPGLLEPVEKSTVKLKRNSAKFLASAFSNSNQISFILISSDSTRVPCYQSKSPCSISAGRYLSVIVKIWTFFSSHMATRAVLSLSGSYCFPLALSINYIFLAGVSLCIRELFGKNILAFMASPWENVLSVAAFKRVSCSWIRECLNLGENKNISCI